MTVVQRRAVAAGVRRWAVHALACALIAVAVVAAYDRGFVNYDHAYALSWGAQLASGDAPSYGVPLPPTPHPLTNLEGVLLSPFGSSTADVATLLGAVMLAVLGYLTFLVGRELAGPLAGVVAAVLVLTRDEIVFWGGLRFLDVTYCVLILGAVLLELTPQRRERAVLVLLFLAGLLRPEAWLLSLGYLALVWKRTGALPPFGLLALAVAAPVVWVAVDLVTTGRPLYSFTLTTELTDVLGRISGPGAIPDDVPRTIGQVARPAVAVAGAIGLILALRANPSVAIRLLAFGTAVTAATALVIAAGTPLNSRYLLFAPIVACIFCGAAVARIAASGRATRAAGLVALAILAVGAPSDGERLRQAREDMARERTMMNELERVADEGVRGCGRLIAHSRAAPWLSLWHERRPTAFIARSSEMPPAAVITPTADPLPQQFVRYNGDTLPAGGWERVAPSFRGRFWTLRLACRRGLES